MLHNSDSGSNAGLSGAKSKICKEENYKQSFRLESLTERKLFHF
jgi:hypothetical protein